MLSPLKDSALLESAIIHSLNGLALADLEGKLIYVNPAFVKLWGHRHESDILGRSAVDFWVKPQEAETVIQTMINHGHWSGELDAIRADGSIFTASLSGVLITDDHGKPSHFLGSFVDVTNRKLAERALQDSEQRLKEAQRIAHVGSWELDINTGELVWSDEIYRIFEIDKDRFGASYDAFLNTIHPDDREQVNQAFTSSIASKTPYEITHRLLLNNGQVKFVRERGETFYDATGQPLRSAGTVQDVTQQILSEQELVSLNDSLEQRVQERTIELESERNFISTVLDIAGALVVVVDKHGHIVRYNQACETTTGFNFSDYRYTPVWDWLIPEADRPGVIKTFNDLKNLTLPNYHENHWLTRDGQQRLIAWSNSIIKNTQGEVEYIVGTGIDITERHQAEQQLIKAKEEAEKANMAKSDFLSRMSHELRTPMNAILGFSQILERETLTDAQQEFVNEIQLAGNHLLSLINDLLDLSRIEAGKLTIVIEPVNIRQIVQDVISLLEPSTYEHSITLHNKCHQDSNVLADATRLKQILTNLISNAIKYNRKHGQVTIDCALIDNQMMRIIVTDTGYGIEESDIHKLFTPFERLGAELSGIDGTGIGLALSRTLVKHMGGDIGIESRVDKGSTFWIDLPASTYSIQHTSASDELATSRLDKTTLILYIEDNAANLRLVESMLKLHPGFKLISATNGRHGIELARRYKPDIILLDIHLPDIDGYAVFRELQNDKITQLSPVIALSADAMQFDIDRGLEAGFRDYLTKPIMFDDLISTLESVIAEINRT